MVGYKRIDDDDLNVDGNLIQGLIESSLVLIRNPSGKKYSYAVGCLLAQSFQCLDGTFPAGNRTTLSQQELLLGDV